MKKKLRNLSKYPTELKQSGTLGNLGVKRCKNAALAEHYFTVINQKDKETNTDNNYNEYINK